MRTSVVRYLALVPLGLLLACSGGDPGATAGDIQPITASDVATEAAGDPTAATDGPAAEPETPPQAEPESAPDDPFAMDDPADVDVEYVDLVMAELLAVSNAVLEDVLESDLSEGLTEDDITRIRAVYSGPRLIHLANRFQVRATDEVTRSAYLDSEQRTGARWETVRVLASDAACIVAIGQHDVTGTAKVPYPDDERVVVVLAAMDPERRTEYATHNPTPWRMHEMESLTVGDPRVPIPEEEWPDLDYAGVLDLPCVEAVL